jgi:hypothetical protein
MTARTMIMLFAGSAVLATSSPVMAQRWGSGPFPREGVCFYRDPNFRGEYFCASAGENLSRVPSGMNDRISSIRILGRVDVTVFRDIQYEGRSTRFNSDVRDLKDEGWNDLISSIRVRGTSFGFGGDRSPGRSNGDPERIVRRAYQDILDREPDSSGLRLYRSRIIDDGWSESDVREALRKSPEFREKSTMTQARAQDIVRRAYLSILKREPDSGSHGYVDRVLRDHWTQQDVERELRKSAEYRGRRH